MTMPRGRVDLVEGVQDLPCPCGGKVHAGRTASGQYMVFHSLPACPKFIDLEPGAFLQWRRETLERTIGGTGA